MTEQELVKFIKTVYYTFDRSLVPREVTEYAAAWAPYLKEFDYALAQQVLPNVCLGKEFPPRPWEIRVALIDHVGDIDRAPSSPQAWIQYQSMMADVANGTVSNWSVHPALHATLVAVQGVGLNNQFDAKRFETIYEDKVKEWFKKTYGMGTKQ